ncbi:MAG: glycosyltransferase family 39 protein [Planctomycetota bacterium]|nr:glycosyltransferase family 39 protein [Planctomycetota bacterium]
MIDAAARTHTISPRAALLYILAVGAALFAVRLAGPADFLANDQLKPIAYINDVLQFCEWICQTVFSGAITSKPPLYTWIAELASLPFGGLSRFSLYLPCAAGIIGAALLCWRFARVRFGESAGVFAAAALLLSTYGAKHIALARTDALFIFTATLAALLGYAAWIRGRGWTWFWLACALATLTKGPLGLVIASGGLLAVLWERKSAEPAPLRGRHWLGVALFLIICGGWFFLAWLDRGQALIDKMLGRELMNHAVAGNEGQIPFIGFPKPSLYFLSRFLPWSILAAIGFWRVARRPAADAAERRFERYLFCWFFAGLILFSLAAAQRGDHLMPILPAAAMLAGRELDRLLRLRSPAMFWGASISAAVIVIAGFGYYYNVARLDDREVRASIGVSNLAEQIRAECNGVVPTVNIDDRYALQSELGTLWRPIEVDRAADLLVSDHQVIVSTRAWEALEAAVIARGGSMHRIASWDPRGESAETPHVSIFSNRPTFPDDGDLAAAAGPLDIFTSGSRLLRAEFGTLIFRIEDEASTVRFTNRSDARVEVRLRMDGAAAPNRMRFHLAPNETREVEFERRD